MKKIFTSFVLLLGIWANVFSQDFYDISTVNVIEITFTESNWDAILDTYKANDNDEKLKGTAVVNGVTYDNVGVKYKGNSTYSASNAKNPLHIYLDYIDDQDYDGYESIKLSNGKKDPSFVREVLSYEIARKYTDAPKSNYAKVYINGSYYGLFSSSEAINGDFVDRRLDADNDNTRIKCNPESTFDGNGPSLEYLGADSSSYYSYYEVKSDYGWKDLMDFTYSLAYTPDDIEKVLDIDRAIWMLAFNNVLVNLDSYTGAFRQNYYLIKDDNGRFMPVIWDLNESLGGFTMIDMGGTNTGGGGPGGPPQGGTTTDNTSITNLDPYLREDDTTYPLLKMIFDNDRYKKMYIAHCKTILEENFVNGWYTARAAELQSVIASELAADPNAFYTSAQFSGNIASTQDGVIGISELMSDRITYLQSHAAFNYTQPTVSNVVYPDDAKPNENITVTADIIDATYVYLGYRYSKDEAFVKIEMFDDGLHNDVASGDGTYGASFDIDETNTHFYIYAENAEAGIFSPEQAEHEYYKVAPKVLTDISTDVVINEVLASNSSVQADENKEFDDWIELYNNTNSDISLSGYYLSDDATDIMQWAFPDTVIKANDYFIIWADNDEEQEGLHAGFKLSSSGEGVYLSNSDFTVVNKLEYSTQYTDYAYASNPNGSTSFVIQGATFGFNNEETAIPNDEIDFSKLTGVEELINGGNSIQVYPVPVSEVLYIKSGSSLENAEVSVFNIYGQAIIVASDNSSDIFELNVSELSAGVYILLIENEGIQTKQRFVKE